MRHFWRADLMVTSGSNPKRSEVSLNVLEDSRRKKFCSPLHVAQVQIGSAGSTRKVRNWLIWKCQK